MNAIVARYVTYRSAGHRGVFAVILDIDEDQAERAFELLGGLSPGLSTHVAMVRLGGDPEDPEAVVHGVYAASRSVKERKAYSVTVEIPGERQLSTNRKLGLPTTTRPIDVVLAVLAEEPVFKEPTAAQKRDVVAAAIQRCGILCKEPAFQRFILGRGYVEADDAGNQMMTEAEVRQQLGVQSRREFRTDPDKLAVWFTLLRRYEEWLQGGRLPGEN